MNTSNLILVSVIVLLTIAFVTYAILTAGKLSALEAESNVLETKLANRDAEITHLRTQQAHKIDRALFMLAKVRSDRRPTEPPQPIRTPFATTLVLDACLVDAIALGHESGNTEFRDILAQHLARRVVKSPALTGGQRS